MACVIKHACVYIRTHQEWQGTSSTHCGCVNVPALGCEIRKEKGEKKASHIHSSVILLLSGVKVACGGGRWNALSRAVFPFPLRLLSISSIFPSFPSLPALPLVASPPLCSGAPVTSRRWSARLRHVPRPLPFPPLHPALPPSPSCTSNHPH